MTLRFELDPELTDGLRDQITDVWVEATNAGGAVGFVAPVERETVAAKTETTLAGVVEGLDHLVVGYHDEEDGTRGEVAAWLVVSDFRFRLKDHVRLLKCVMVHPKFQGHGYGAELMREAERVARTLDGVEMLELGCRGGLGLEQFYGKCGYREAGRLARGLRVAADDYRDEITMQLFL
jgi:GNAT superfamily N-acetyltransferase